MFKPGQSGNPKGKPKGSKNKDSIGGLIRAKKGLKEELFNDLCELRKSADETIKLKATIATIEFGWGKAVQTVESPALDEIAKTYLVRPK